MDLAKKKKKIPKIETILVHALLSLETVLFILKGVKTPCKLCTKALSPLDSLHHMSPKK